MRPGDIVLVAFPQTDLKRGKLRPALCLRVMPGRYGDVFLAMISSRTHQLIEDFDDLIRSDDADFPSSGLKATSVIRLSRLATVDRHLIVAKLGTVDKKRFERICQRIAYWCLD